MRKLLLVLLLMFILLFTLPLILLDSCEVKEKSGSDYEKFTTMKGSLSIKVYNSKLNEVVEMDLEDYILSVLAGEMPASFHMEALKAQSLAARTYTVMRIRAFGGKGCTQHAGADVCTDSVHCQAFVDIGTLSGEKVERLKQAVESTKGEVIVYQDNLIDAVFHSTSGGRTENSEDIWESVVPYLRGVESVYEQASPKLVTYTEMKISDFISRIKKLDSSVKINAKNIKKEIEIIDRSSGGRITVIKIGNKRFKGEKVRTALGLNSGNFEIEYAGDIMKFRVMGNGHGIGMSQYGADGLAKLGYLYTDIVKHYYKGVEIVNVYELLNGSVRD
ncbi:MAG: stage II sporulation protein D [Bacillota bacterium]